MRIRLWTAMLVSGLALAGVLATICRVPAGEIPSVPPVPPVALVKDEEAPPPSKPQQIPEVRQVIDALPMPIGAPEPKAAAEVRVETPAVPTMMVNSRCVKLNFKISEVGPSGVSSVELWATRDGKAWQRYSNEPPPSGPLVVHVAEEGRYGFSILVRNGLGLSSPEPKYGDAPQMWVDVDETKPVVKMTECHLETECDLEKGPGSMNLQVKGPDITLLHVKWKASDKNMAEKPITICTSQSKEGPWTPIATGLLNSGGHTWRVPTDMPYEFYVRVEATDRAGNVGCAVTHEPMKVDRARPRGTIIGVDAEKVPVTKVTVPSEAEREPMQRFTFAPGWSR